MGRESGACERGAREWGVSEWGVKECWACVKGAREREWGVS